VDRPEVLVVSDERPTRAFVVRALSSSYDVIESKDSRGAIKAITASDRDFRVVIVSRRAVKNRTQASATVGLVKTMYERWPWIPVVLLGRIPDRARLTGQMLLSGARTLVQKPVTAAAFRAAVTRVVGRTGKRSPTASAVAAMNRIRTFLGEHTEETLTLRELSAMASMSRSHFSHTFHVVLGMSLRDYVRDLRLQRAHLLLLASPLSLTAIAAESGFYDLPHLDKAFRHRLGVSPLEFRRRYNTRAQPKASAPARAEAGGS
jgi:AraC-like DNA-binding protein/CheY-like chemotaxis protein